MVERLEDLLVLSLQELAVASQSRNGTLSDYVNTALIDSASAASRLSRALAADPECCRLFDLHMNMNGMSQPLDQRLARDLIVGAASSHRQRRIIADLRELARTGITSSIGYFPITGLKVEIPIRLLDGADIVPWDSEVRAVARSFFGGPLEGLVPLNGMSLRPFPTCALRVELPARQVLFKDMTGARDMSDWLLAQRQTGALAAAVGLCATLLAQKPIAPLGSWYSSTNEAAACLGGSGFLLTPQADNRRLIGSSMQPVGIPPAELVDAVGAFLGFNGHAATSLRVALERVSSALLSRSLIDRFIDVGIAAEVLLLHEAGADRPKNKLTNRLWNRGMHLLGGDVATMDANACLLYDLYDARSFAVHTGTIPDEVGGRTPSSLMIAATQRLAAIAQIILREGEFPEWSRICPDADLEPNIATRRARVQTAV